MLRVLRHIQLSKMRTSLIDLRAICDWDIPANDEIFFVTKISTIWLTYFTMEAKNSMDIIRQTPFRPVTRKCVIFSVTFHDRSLFFFFLYSFIHSLTTELCGSMTAFPALENWFNGTIFKVIVVTIEGLRKIRWLYVKNCF